MGFRSSFPVLVEVAVGSGSETDLAGVLSGMLRHYNKGRISLTAHILASFLDRPANKKEPPV